MGDKSENVLYWGSGSPPCWRVMITLAEKGVKFTDKLLSFANKEHKSPEVLALNPRGQVPTLKLGNVAVNDSLAACDYLEDINKKQGTQLIPDDPAEKALVIQRKYEALNLHKKGIEDLVFYMFGKNPQKEVIEERKESCRGELKIWDGHLYATGPGAYAAGKRFSMADVVFYPSLAFLVRMGLQLNPRYPSLGDYYNRLSTRPSIKSNWPPHWQNSKNNDLLKDL